ncbi:bestrophin-2 isoform X1 [Macrosteles quadrilineatus]|uniref:bestrophin-2 isoform X1 n=1 Tax=Macrosteles quadrilineatus TaxID=74068 RepID=UPI0023E1E848|nr:bestrophin-2 isoform X1 [Macrosteles quadrilineatus]
MTISYSRLVANGSSFGCFWSILTKWRGSVYKLVWRELIAYLSIYYAINLTYRFAMTEHQQRTFEWIREYFAKNNLASTLMTFVMGFYVNLIVSRWWEQYRLLPWPDTLALFVSAAVQGQDERGRLMRRNIVRYAILAYVITLKHVSVRVKKRFPTLQHIVDAGIMLESEKKIVEMMDSRSPMAKYWMPLVWATNIINRARRDNLIMSDQLVQTLLFELSEHRRKLGSIISYDTVCVPLVYTQVVTLSVYSYFLANLLGKQFIITERSPTGNIEFDMYFPIFTVLQFVFYVGWLKVAEVLIGPFGEDDDDIELNWLIDRHIKAAYMIVDEMHEEHPELLKDQYWDEVVPKDLPYTVASEHYRKYEPKGSAEDYKVKEQDALYANLLHSRKSINPDDVYADYESVDTPLVERRKNWFQRQMHRVGSIRSSSTAYSSGLFGRQRHNSVYSTPDQQNGLPISVVGGGQSHAPPYQQNPHKMSIYDRLIGRKSTRQNRNRPGPLKMNGSVVMKNRPRIPTPDVTKEVVDRENRLAQMNLNNNNANSGGTVSPNSLVSALVAHNPVPYAHTDTQLPVAVQVVLSPIQESESHQNTITPNTPGAAALAQAVLANSLNPAGLSTAAVLTTSHPINTSAVLTTAQHPITMSVSPVTFTTVSMSNPMLTSLGITPSSAPHTPVIAHRSLVLTDVTQPVTEEGSSAGSVSGDDRSRKASVTSQPKRGEVYV